MSNEKQEEQTTKIAKIQAGVGGLQLSGLDEMYRFAKYVVAGGLAPSGDRPEAVVVKLQAGAELGLSPMKSLSLLTAVNGRVGIMAEGACALIESAGVTKEPIGAFMEGQGDDLKGVCTSWRKGKPKPFRTEFTVAQAKQARLWGKSGPWSQYPERMLTRRAIGFHCRDHYADVLSGIATTEELRDIPPSVDGPTEHALPPAAPDPLLETAQGPIDVTPVEPTGEPTPEEQKQIQADEIAEADSLFGGDNG